MASEQHQNHTRPHLINTNAARHNPHYEILFMHESQNRTYSTNITNAFPSHLQHFQPQIYSYSYHHQQQQQPQGPPSPPTPEQVRIAQNLDNSHIPQPIYQPQTNNPRYQQQHQHNQSFSSCSSLSTSTTFPVDPDPFRYNQHNFLSEEDAKFQYHYNLLRKIREPLYHNKIALHAKLSGAAISLWCIINMYLVAQCDTYKKSERDHIFNHLLLFLITMLIVHKDIILCNGQACLPLLCLFNFTIIGLMEYAVNLGKEWQWDSKYGLNALVILLILLYSTQRFIFDFMGNPGGFGKDFYIEWNLMRCHLYYRGWKARWITFVSYSWWNSLMILQLMDNVCIKNIFNNNENWEFFGMKRFKFISCDIAIVVYGVFVMWLWMRLKNVDIEWANTLYVNYKLNVKGYPIWEVAIFIAVFLGTFALSETVLAQLMVKQMLIPLTVVLVLVVNFLMR